MKKLHRFLLKETPSGDSISITDTEIVHLMSHVLKLNAGEICVLFASGSDDYECKITEISKKTVSLSVVGKNKKQIVPKNITACISITKRDNFELVVQKLTELGVQNIVPILSDRTIKQSLRLDRLQKISDEALELSGGSDRVNITLPLSLKEALEVHKSKEQYYFDIDGESYKKTEVSDLVFYIGPEGGWSDSDKEIFNKYNAKSCKLGNTVLRAETAAIVAAYTLIWH
ncbi:MAG: RsmE family RNA methyltransferase [Patescibacteria group bacterium]